MSLLVPAYPGCPGSKAVKRSLLLLLLLLWAVVSAGYPALLSSSYFERINDDDDDDEFFANMNKCISNYQIQCLACRAI